VSWERGVDLAADAVVFHIANDGGVSLLLILRKGEPFKDRWALPGGGVELDEETRDACERELAEETSLVAPFDQNQWTALTVRAKPLRDPRGRVVSFPYAIVLRGPRPPVKAQDDAKEVRWQPLKELRVEDLAFDHARIILEAADLHGLRVFER
jgi:8-oxo-dGTP diphosphatase